MLPGGQPTEGLLNDVACVSCKSRKIRCNRTKPRCDCCFARRQKCVYPERKKRSKVSNPQGAAALRKRLVQVEQQLNDRLLEACRQPRTTEHAARTNVVDSGLSCHNSPVSHSDQRDATQSSSPPSATTTTTEAAEGGDSDIGSLPEHPDPQVCLKLAMNRVAECKRRGLDRDTACVEGPVSPELAKACLDSFCKHYQADLIDDFINMKLMYLIPDLVHTPEVRIHPLALMLYHVMLYHGALNLLAANTSKPGNFLRRFYVRCLRFIPDWNKQAAGSKTDLIAAILLIRAAFQQCDFEFSWSMYKLVCFCTVKLNMHIFDKAFPNAFVDPKPLSEGAEQYRRGFWGLIHTDLVFRLLHDRPAMLTANVDNWHVNLPALEVNPELPAFAVPNLAFLVRFRLIFHLLRFYEVTGQCSKDDDNKARFIEELCGKIEDLFEEWPVADLMTENEDAQTLWWVLYEVTLTACCSVMAMSQELAGIRARLPDHPASEDEASPHPLSVKIARRILRLAIQGMDKFPITPTASIVWGVNRCHMAYGCLVQHLASTDPATPENKAADLYLLKETTRALARVTESDSDFMPLLCTLLALNETIQAD